MSHCNQCGGLIAEQGKVYSRAGKFCYCPVPAQKPNGSGGTIESYRGTMTFADTPNLADHIIPTDTAKSDIIQLKKEIKVLKQRVALLEGCEE